MNTGRRVRLFGAAFALTIVVVAVAAILRSSDTGSDAAATTAVTNASTTTSDDRPSPRTTTTSVATVTTASPPKDLPSLDFTRVCTELEGQETQFVETSDRFGLVCRTPDGQDLPIDVRNACEATFGEGSRAVLIEVEQGADAWRCSTRERVALGSPDWDAECERRFGEGAAAFLIADDSLGWRCGSVSNGIYIDDEIAWDAACQTTYGPQSFGEVLGPLPDDNVCYGAA